MDCIKTPSKLTHVELVWSFYQLAPEQSPSQSEQ